LLFILLTFCKHRKRDGQRLSILGRRPKRIIERLCGLFSYPWQQMRVSIQSYLESTAIQTLSLRMRTRARLNLRLIRLRPRS